MTRPTVWITMLLTLTGCCGANDEGYIEIKASTSDGTADVDGPRIQDRLAALGIDVLEFQVDDDAGTIVMRVSQVQSYEALMAAVLRQAELGFYAVAQDQGPLAPGEAPPDVPGIVRGTYFSGEEVWEAETADALRPWLASLELPENRLAAIECREKDGQQVCSPWLLEFPPPLTGGHVESANVELDTFGRPYVMLVFDDQGQLIFSDFTAMLAGRYLAIVVDGEILSAPVVQERIGGGRARIDMGAGDLDQTMVSANALAAAIGTGSLQGEWDLDEVKLVGAP